MASRGAGGQGERPGQGGPAGRPIDPDLSRAVLGLWRREGKWADVALEGISMDPLIRDGAVLRVRFGEAPASGPGRVRPGDVILYHGAQRLIAHRVVSAPRRGRRAGCLLVKGDPLDSWKASWIGRQEVLGRVAAVTQPDGTRISLNTPLGRAVGRVAAFVSRALGRIEASLPGWLRAGRQGGLTRSSLRILEAAHRVLRRRAAQSPGRFLSPEERFLVSACRPTWPAGVAQTARRAASEVTDWALVRELAVSLGLAPMLHDSLSRPELAGICPDGIFEALARSARAGAYLAIERRRELEQVLDALHARGVSPILLKGAALSLTVYEQPALRTMSDLDLLVPETAMEAGVRALEAIGYRPFFRQRHASETARAAFYGRHHHTTPLVDRKGRTVVELHRHLLAMKQGRGYDVETIRARARRIAFAGREVLVPAPSDLVVHTCLHLSYGDRFVGKLRDLVDLHETVTRLGAGIDWEQIVEEVPSVPAARCLYASLDLARRLHGTPVPEEALAELRRASGLGVVASWLIASLARSVLTGGADAGRSILPAASARWCCDALIKETSWPSRLRALASLLSEG